MAGPRDEQEIREEFQRRYEIGQAEPMLAVEREVLGSDYGASGFTTIQQADELSRLLELEPGKRLLDLGTGCGWPGLYLAKTTGCEAVLSDVPIEGLLAAQARIRRDGLSETCSPVAASADHLPFRPSSFDAITHTDVLC